MSFIFNTLYKKLDTIKKIAFESEFFYIYISSILELYIPKIAFESNTRVDLLIRCG